MSCKKLISYIKCYLYKKKGDGDQDAEDRLWYVYTYVKNQPKSESSL